MKKIIRLAAAALLLSGAVSLYAEDNNHTFTGGYGSSGFNYARNFLFFTGKDDFYGEDSRIHNFCDFVYADNTDKAKMKSFFRLNELFVAETQGYRLTAVASSAFFRGSSFGDSLQYFVMGEKRNRLSSGRRYFDYGIGLTNAVIYKRIFPGPVPFPVFAYTSEKPGSIIRIGLPMMFMLKMSRIETGFNWTPLFNSKAWIKWKASSAVQTELFSYTNRYQLVTGDPKKGEVLNIFHWGLFLQADIKPADHFMFSVGGGYDIMDRQWNGNLFRIDYGRINVQKYGTWVAKISASALL